MNQPVGTRYAGLILIDQACERLTGKKTPKKQKPQMMGSLETSPARFGDPVLQGCFSFSYSIYLHSSW